MSISKVIKNGYCVGCGACKLPLDKKINFTMGDNGFYQAKMNVKDIDTDQLDAANKVCPFSNDILNETVLGRKLYASNPTGKYDERVGFYNKVYAGHILNESDRINSSSGGLTTWFVRKLMENSEVDAVIHVGAQDGLINYQITDDIASLNSVYKKKSRYYPVSFEKIINEVNLSKKKYVFVGIPCFVKSIRLAQQQGYLKNITYCISLLCGHMKSAFFAESLAWQLGVKPGKLNTIDFRIKKQGFKASDYFIEVEDQQLNKKQARNGSLFGTNWGLGFFKHKSCDFCEDIAGELADVTLGDAWLPRFVKDSYGTNILITRDNLFDRYLAQYRSEIELIDMTVNDFYESQAGNYRNRREGLLTRINASKTWVPVKRTNLSTLDISYTRKKIYIHRQKLSLASTRNFARAKKIKCHYIFRILMLNIVFSYTLRLSGLRRASVEIIKTVISHGMLKKLREIIR